MKELRSGRRTLLGTAVWLGVAWLALLNATYGESSEPRQARCANLQTQDVSESLDGVSRIVIAAGPSELSISGEPGRTSLNVVASLCHDDTKPSVHVRRENTTLHLAVTRPDGGRRFLIGPSTSLGVKVFVPHGARIEIVEMIGPTSIREVSAVTVRGGLGTLAISDISGDVHVRKGMGAMSIMRVAGSADVSDGAGQLLLSKIEGNVRVAEDGAGQIMIDTVRGNVLVESDGSGEIRIAQTTGNVLIRHDASGAIVVHDIGGAFTVEDKTSGSIVHSDVRGTVQIPVLKKLAKRGPR